MKDTSSVWLVTVPGMVWSVLHVYSPAWEVKRLLNVNLLVRNKSVVGPDPEIEKFAPLLIIFPDGSSHCTARVVEGWRADSRLVLQVNV